METKYLISVKDRFQAAILKDVLMDQGIDSFFKNEAISCVFANSPGFQIEVYVYELDYEKATEILAEAFPDLI